MDGYNIYQDIANRTEGNIYIGVVGPVRTGKSTFIKRFMDLADNCLFVLESKCFQGFFIFGGTLMVILTKRWRNLK